MSDDIPADTASEPTHQSDDDRYARISLQDGAIIVYDRNHTSAWIQSDVAVPLPSGPSAGEAPPDVDRATGGGE
ncbi:DUF7331 family protein [Halobaculum marinum]|uniref:Uncharacterized protein n=1 Tax=Halobaculum marinum TaxID=3031996 RepID=A0ABD5X7N4_9EURY|nr:hypothetical protein [Halobaculum sp. DT55]